MRVTLPMMVIGFLATAGCARPKSPEIADPLPSADWAEAVVTLTHARFVFPRETTREFTWNVPAPDASPGMPEFGWQVRWDRPWERIGKDPHALWAIVYWRPGGPRTGSLRALLNGWKPMVMTACVECGTPASIPREESSVRLQTSENRVVFTVEGAAAIKRLFSTPPDTVIFSRLMGRGGETEVTVAVQH